MQPSKTFKLWLGTQCQMLGCVSAAILVRTAHTNRQILAKWPSGEVDLTHLRTATRPVLDKQHLHLRLIEGNRYLLGHPLMLDGECWGILACELQIADKKQLPTLLQSIKLGQSWLQFILQQAQGDSAPADTRPSAESDIAPAPLKDPISAALVHLSASLLKEDSLQEAAITLVNVLAGMLQATRVSLGLRDLQGKALVLEAVSFSANFDRRTQAMQAVTEAMAEAIEQGVSIECAEESSAPEESGQTGSIIKQAHEQLLHSQQLRWLGSFLLRKGDRILGALTIELDKRSLDPEQALMVQQLCHIAGGIFLLRQQANAGVWQGLRQRTVTRLQRLLGRDSWHGKLAAVLCVVGLVALWVPAVTYRLSADANVQAMEKHLVVSPQDAYLGEVAVRPGHLVTKGELLARLNDEDLRLERRKLASQAQQYRQAYDSALANADRVEAAIANAQLEQASIQIQLLDQQLARTQLLAPVEGIIVSDDISQNRGAPIKQGEVLFEIAASSTYLVHLFVDERDIAQVEPGQKGELKLSSLPGETFAMRVTLITPISEVREGRNYFRVELALEEGAAATLRPGMTGTGKVTIGKRALGWIWFHDIWHWLRLSWW